jgi:HD-GYP domain-containing protein (c-di-GMP phosphodiesterase class II)
MTTDRSYRKARPAEEAIAELRRCSGTDFDPAVVDALAAAVSAPA